MKRIVTGLICCVGGTGVLLAASLAVAATIPTSYFVDEKELRSNAPAGTMLTFELHADPNCTAAITSETVDVDDVTVKERVKTRNVSGGAKPLKLVELNHVFTASPTPGTDLYVKVTGSGIDANAVGACQAQEPFGSSLSACTMVPRPGVGVVAAYGTPPGANVFPVCCPAGLRLVTHGWQCPACPGSLTDVYNWQDSVPVLGLLACAPADGWDFQINDNAVGIVCTGAPVDAFVVCCP
jgi:hypothetical protein